MVEHEKPWETFIRLWRQAAGRPEYDAAGWYRLARTMVPEAEAELVLLDITGPADGPWPVRWKRVSDDNYKLETVDSRKLPVAFLTRRTETSKVDGETQVRVWDLSWPHPRSRARFPGHIMTEQAKHVALLESAERVGRSLVEVG